ncbi:MAG: hypothetical protein ACLSHG_01645 [Oscillospiraceae bacterium]
MQFDTLYASHSYEVVAAIETEIPAEGSDAFRYYDCIGTDPEQFAQYCTFIEQNRCYDTGITIQPGDRLLTLSTCAYHTGERPLSGRGAAGRLKNIQKPRHPVGWRGF